MSSLIGQSAAPAAEDLPAAAMRPYLVNLDRSPERLAFIDERFRARGIGYQRVAAVEGSSLSPDQIRAVYTRADGTRELSSGEVGCFLSHRRCWQLIVESGVAHGCVFEDDVEVSPHLSQFLDASTWIPADADLVKLESYIGRVWFDRRTIALADGFSLTRMRSRHIGCAAYVISRKAARRLLDGTRHFRRPVDVLMFEPGRGIFGDLVVYQVLPALAKQSAMHHRSGPPGVLPPFMISTLQDDRDARRLPRLTRMKKFRHKAIRAVETLAHRLRGRKRLAVSFDSPPIEPADNAPAGGRDG